VKFDPGRHIEFSAFPSRHRQIAGAVFLYNACIMIGRWLPFALLCSIFLATADFFVKLASSKISASMGMFIYGATTFAFGLAWVGYLKITGQPLLVTRTGLLYSFAVGLAFSLVTMLLYITFARISVSIGSPTIRVTGILLASLLGLLVLREPVTWRYILGLILTIAGVTLIVLR
jgi:bacterial/archaeal transporter family protein